MPAQLVDAARSAAVTDAAGKVGGGQFAVAHGRSPRCWRNPPFRPLRYQFIHARISAASRERASATTARRKVRPADLAIAWMRWRLMPAELAIWVIGRPAS